MAAFREARVLTLTVCFQLATMVMRPPATMSAGKVQGLE